MKSRSISPPPYIRPSKLELENYDSSDAEGDANKFETIALCPKYPYPPKSPKASKCNSDVCSYIFFCFNSQ